MREETSIETPACALAGTQPVTSRRHSIHRATLARLAKLFKCGSSQCSYSGLYISRFSNFTAGRLGQLLNSAFHSGTLTFARFPPSALSALEHVPAHFRLGAPRAQAQLQEPFIDLSIYAHVQKGRGWVMRGRMQGHPTHATLSTHLNRQAGPRHASGFRRRTRTGDRNTAKKQGATLRMLM